MLRLLEMLREQGGEGTSGALERAYLDVPTNGAIPDTAFCYLQRGLVTIICDGKRQRVPLWGKLPNYSKDYHIKFTQAGWTVANALLTLPVKKNEKGLPYHCYENNDFWMGKRTTLTLLPYLVAYADEGNPYWDGKHNFLRPFIDGQAAAGVIMWAGVVMDQLSPSCAAAEAMNEYMRAGLLTGDGAEDAYIARPKIEVTPEGRILAEALVEAERMAFPIRTKLGRGMPRISEGASLAA